MELLVEGVCVPKHLVHIRHFGHVPLVERLVEGSCVLKHIPHIRHVGHVPIIERLVEAVCEIKVSIDFCMSAMGDANPNS